ncbi:uncharacterized protein LOC141852540 [Brevipalpus obovatus]|uniref:uncharacterized protein LOC141852540 n=1 Tax=Brevipalpus obovatus TaxID=246614 RepID=UPI003D9F740B
MYLSDLVLLLFIYVFPFSHQTNGHHCIKAKLPLHDGERRPLPFVVHIWVSRADTGEHSCIGIIRQGNRIMVPEWCINVKGEKRGRIAIYAPKMTGKVNSLSRSSAKRRYDEQFDFVYEDDDLKELVVDEDKDQDQDQNPDLPNVVTLKIPEDISHLKHCCLWRIGNLFTDNKKITAAVIAWQRGPNGEYFLVQKVIDESVKAKRSYEAMGKGVEDVAEALLSVSHDNGDTWTFDGFFKNPPRKSAIKIVRKF